MASEDQYKYYDGGESDEAATGEEPEKKVDADAAVDPEEFEKKKKA